MNPRDQMSVRVDLMRLKCAPCGKKPTRTITWGIYPLPWCDTCYSGYMGPTKRDEAIYELAKQLDGFAGAGDITGCQMLLARRRRDVFGGGE
jgi:hypothetical protein